MRAQNTQISAWISGSTSAELDRFVETRGMKKAFVIEQALKFHLRALRELPPDVIVPARIVVDAETAAKLADRVQRARKPTPAMRALFGKK